MNKTAIPAAAPAIVSRSVEPTVSPKAAYSAVHSNGEVTSLMSLAPNSVLKRVLEPISSLKLTVILFALSMVIIFFGTVAQKEMGIWHAVSMYFRSWFLMLPVKVILFNTIEHNPFSIPFPGGWTLGALLFTNLLAAHSVRLKLSWKRSGIFILHAGVLVMMLSEFITGMWAVEGVMQIVEGHRSNYVNHLMDPEFSVIDASDPKIDDTVVVPHRILRRGPVSHEALPFDIELLDYYTNAVAVEIQPGTTNLATAGLGTLKTVREEPEVSGTDPNQKFDRPAAYLKLTERATGRPLGTYLVYYFWPDQPITVGDKTYEIALRPKRTYRPFSVQLDKADFKVYPGTMTPKDYSSYVTIRDENGAEIRKTRIFMNNPMYFNNETYYQASMDVESQPITTGLQVVYDPGKLIPLGLPIISCIMVGIGMLIHFGLNLISFLQRRIAT